MHGVRMHMRHLTGASTSGVRQFMISFIIIVSVGTHDHLPGECNNSEGGPKAKADRSETAIQAKGKALFDLQATLAKATALAQVCKH